MWVPRSTSIKTASPPQAARHGCREPRPSTPRPEKPRLRDGSISNVDEGRLTCFQFHSGCFQGRGLTLDHSYRSNKILTPPRTAPRRSRLADDSQTRSQVKPPSAPRLGYPQCKVRLL